MAICFTNPPNSIFASYESWQAWLETQPGDVQGLFSRSHVLADGTVYVPVSAPTEGEFYSVLHLSPEYKQIADEYFSRTADFSYGGSGLFSKRYTEFMVAATGTEGGKPCLAREGVAPVAAKRPSPVPPMDTEQQMRILRAEVLPGLEQGVKLIDQLVTSAPFTFELGQFDLPPVVFNLLSGYISGILSGMGSQNLHQQLKSMQVEDPFLTAMELYDSFAALKVGEQTLWEWLSQNHARLKAELDYDPANEQVGLLSIPKSLAGLMAGEIFSKDFLWQLRGIDDTQAYQNVVEGMGEMREGIAETIDNIQDIGTWQELSLINATDRYSVFKLLEYFPNPKAQEYLLKKIGIEPEVLAAETRPESVSDETWRAHQEFKSLQTEFGHVNIAAGVATTAAVIGLCALAPYLSPLFAVAVAGTGVAMGVGMPVLDLLQEENKNMAVWSSFAVGSSVGDQGVHEVVKEEDTETADRRLGYALVMTPVQIAANVVGMGASARIATSGLSLTRRVAADAAAGAVIGGATPLADGRQWEDGTVVEAVVMGGTLGAVGGAVGTAVGPKIERVFHELPLDYGPYRRAEIDGLGEEKTVSVPRESLAHQVEGPSYIEQIMSQRLKRASQINPEKTTFLLRDDKSGEVGTYSGDNPRDGAHPTLAMDEDGRISHVDEAKIQPTTRPRGQSVAGIYQPGPSLDLHIKLGLLDEAFATGGCERMVYLKDERGEVLFRLKITHAQKGESHALGDFTVTHEMIEGDGSLYNPKADFTDSLSYFMKRRNAEERFGLRRRYDGDMIADAETAARTNKLREYEKSSLEYQRFSEAVDELQSTTWVTEGDMGFSQAQSIISASEAKGVTVKISREAALALYKDLPVGVMEQILGIIGQPGFNSNQGRRIVNMLNGKSPSPTPVFSQRVNDGGVVEIRFIVRKYDELIIAKKNITHLMDSELARIDKGLARTVKVDGARYKSLYNIPGDVVVTNVVPKGFTHEPIATKWRTNLKTGEIERDWNQFQMDLYRLLEEYGVPRQFIYARGSRINGTPRPDSDFDVGSLVSPDEYLAIADDKLARTSSADVREAVLSNIGLSPDRRFDQSVEKRMMPAFHIPAPAHLPTFEWAMRQLGHAYNLNLNFAIVPENSLMFNGVIRVFDDVGEVLATVAAK